jgi:hypothetical protein
MMYKAQSIADCRPHWEAFSQLSVDGAICLSFLPLLPLFVCCLVDVLLVP